MSLGNMQYCWSKVVFMYLLIEFIMYRNKLN